MSQVTGRCWLYLNGLLLRSKDGAKLTGVGGIERTAVSGAQVWGYSEKVVAPGIEATLAHTGDTSLVAIDRIVNATITFETDTGRTYVLRNAWCESAPDLTAGEGDVTVRFAGMSCEEQS